MIGGVERHIARQDLATTPLLSRAQPRARYALVLLPAAGILAATLVVLVQHSPFSDLAVYRWAGDVAFQSSQLYTAHDPVYGLRFAYTPFAAVLFALFHPVGLMLAAPFSALSLLALARSCVLVARAVPTVFAGMHRLVAAAGLFGLALATEPVTETLRLGQVGLLLTWLILEDLLPPRRRGRGVLTGLATAVKLTPAMFIALLAVVGSWRSTLAGAGTFIATITIGWALLPDETRVFFTGLGADAERFGGIEYAGNQSLNGLALRLLGSDVSPAVHLVGALVACIVCLLAARVWWLSGTSTGRLGAVGLAALASLFASPVSWTHHWVAALPLLVAVWACAARWARVVVALAYVVFCSRIVWRVPHGHGVEFDHDVIEAVIAASYLLVGTALTAVAVIATRRLHAEPTVELDRPATLIG